MYKTNRVNHNFQIEHFLVGACHTPDGAYALLKDLEEERSAAIKGVVANKLRVQAKRVRATKKLLEQDEAIQLEAQADLSEIEANEDTYDRNYKAALDELTFIVDCINRIQPHRKYKHLSDPEAHQAAQQEEWRLELMKRAENYLITCGSIPVDHFATMRLHPEFSSSILPKILEIEQKVMSSNLADKQKLIKDIDKDLNNVTKLLGF